MPGGWPGEGGGMQGRAHFWLMPDLIRASRLRSHPLCGCVPPWTAGTGPGSEPGRRVRRCRHPFHARGGPERGEECRGVPTFGSCPDLIRASRLRCLPLCGRVPPWTAETGPGSEPAVEGARPCRKLRLIPGLVPGIHGRRCTLLRFCHSCRSGCRGDPDSKKLGAEYAFPHGEDTGSRCKRKRPGKKPGRSFQEILKSVLA